MSVAFKDLLKGNTGRRGNERAVSRSEGEKGLQLEKAWVSLAVKPHWSGQVFLFRRPEAIR